MRAFAGVVGVMAGLSILCAGTAQARDWNVIKDSGTVIAATEGAFFPFNYFEGPKLTGFEVELAEAVVAKMGLKIEWRVVSFIDPRNTIRQIAKANKLSDLDVRKIVFGLLQAGLVELARPVGQARPAPPGGARPAPPQDKEKQKSLVNRLISRIRSL